VRGLVFIYRAKLLILATLGGSSAPNSGIVYALLTHLATTVALEAKK